MVAGCRLIITGSALISAFEAMIAPRKLQSFGAAVHAVAAAVSSVRSTSNVVASAIKLEVVINGEVSRTRGTALRLLEELEDALWVDVRNAPTKATSVISEQATILFIVISNLIRFGQWFSSTDGTGDHSAMLTKSSLSVVHTLDGISL